MNTRSISSQYASGSCPSSCARRNTFCECSSLPIRKWRVEPGQPLVTGDDVGGDLLVGRAEMRAAVDEIDRGRQKELHRSNHALAASACTSLIGTRMLAGKPRQIVEFRLRVQHPARRGAPP